ncbi:cirA [Symbiodinium pilosum]|uniref:CirA protein n=1 Tax=Symbiodinium pilosum TaxID=2952 RepID=A0A812LSJ6_SYMPI|nr:cirA [Symbiodinium pilosum]
MVMGAQGSRGSFSGRIGGRIGAVLVAIVMSGAAHAADSVGAESAKAKSNSLIEEMVVTARKRSERLQDVPASAASLSSGFIDDVGGVSNLRDITDLVVGISINETQDASLIEPTIRGAGQARNRVSVSATGLYRNGAYFATNSLGGKNFARLDTYDLERVEVLRGPQGALYGRNALGGSMNMISKKPTDQFEIDLGVSLGEKDLQRYEGKLNLPITDQFAIRASHLYEDRDKGFYNDVNGDDWDNDVDNHNLVIDWTLGGGVLTSVSNYRERQITHSQDWDHFFPAPLNGLLRETVTRVDNEIFFQEIRYVADGSANFNWLVGVDYFSHDNAERGDQWGGQLFANAFMRTLTMSADSWAAFGVAEYTFDSIPLTVTGELRYAEDKIEGGVVAYRVRDQPGVPDRNNPVNPETDFFSDDKFTNLPWAVTAAYRFPERDLMSYVKIASSYRQGGINDFAGSPGLERFPTSLTYGEETSMTYELGLKSSWFDRALSVNAAVYYTEYQDFLNTSDNGCPSDCQLVDVNGNGLGFNPDGSRVGEDANGLPIPPNEEVPTAFFIDNVGKADAWGFEIEGTYRAQFDFGGTLLLNLGYAKGKGEVKSLGDNVSAATAADADGAKLPFLRPNQIKGSAVYRQMLGGLSNVAGFDGAALVGSLTYTYEEGGHVTLTNTDPTAQDTVKRLGARIGLETNSWSFFINGDNLTDYSYKTFNAPDFGFYTRNTPRYIYGEFMLRLRP